MGQSGQPKGGSVEVFEDGGRFGFVVKSSGGEILVGSAEHETRDGAIRAWHDLRGVCYSNPTPVDVEDPPAAIVTPQGAIVTPPLPPPEVGEKFGLQQADAPSAPPVPPEAQAPTNSAN